MSAATRFTLLVPEDWYRLPLVEDAALQRAVAAVVDRQFRGLDDQPLLRRETTEALLERGRRAREGGGVDLYLSYSDVAGVPLALSLLVSVLPLPPGVSSLRAVARDLDAEGSRAELVDLPGGTAVRRRRIGNVDATELGASPDSESLLVDYTFLGPEDTLLLLSFSSPLVQVADALAELFEAVAGSLGWSA